MPLDLLKNTVQGAHDNALQNNMVKVVDPLQIQINQLKTAIIQYQTQQQHQSQDTSETPPPKYQQRHDHPKEGLITKEEASQQNSDPKNHDTPNQGGSARQRQGRDFCRLLGYVGSNTLQTLRGILLMPRRI